MSCPNDAGFAGGSDNGIAQQMQMQYMRDQLRQELQQRSFLSHAQVGLQNISHQPTCKLRCVSLWQLLTERSICQTKFRLVEQGGCSIC